VIDTHCHLLPGIDDGPPTVGDAVALARVLVDHGVDAAVATPHWSRRFATSHDEALQAASTLREALARQAVPLAVHMAAELTEIVAATRPVDEVAERSLGGRSVVVELQPDSLPAQTAAVVARLAAAGLGTVLAHPERCRAVQADPASLDGLRAGGALVQVVAPSLTGRWGEEVRATTWHLLLSARADLLASDAHDLDRRPCELMEARELVVDRLGDEVWDELTCESPGRLLAGAPTG
jgi:protein-tyrosine phosphatase